ncbi:TonB-dependent hemoglobin/transferrin/lactoferrin family receptor [Sphingomonas sp. G-3-2-10]|uniref:TonB-dependent hemoglobin/transferrin/lactoferrin family receptor n=1 Tax=Sphingomonas sp. G-3-2-10 TaxID=2728838 RepID=UPI00146D1374|nr:TonB-dependent hemoglobin/transferrin/lactoferrin family receptor [Sphingomonas sp. G-3-2-10]NML05605.1 TonB-dependent hemoglobin/transferrin/lactoferrin family receptor [Sphingomonas sp. G-3-2-10]
MKNFVRSRLLAGIALAAVGTIGIAAPAMAQDAEQEAAKANPVITVTATRIPVSTLDAPATVSVITSEQIADELATDIKDLVRFEPGVSVPRSPARFGAALGSTGRAGNEGFVIRGIGGNRVLIQVDGVRVPDGFAFGAQSAGRGDYVDVGLVKSVEILRGPASALYGSDGLAGAVSFVTADPSDFLKNGNNIGGLVRASYNSADNEFAETAILAARSGDWSIMGAYTRRDFNELENQGTVGGTGSLRTIANPADGRSNAAFGRIVYEPAGGHKIRLTGEYLDTYLFTDVLSGRSATVDLVQGKDTGKRARIAGDWTWQGEGTIDYARLGVYWQDADDRQFTDEDRTPAVDRERLNTFENRVYGAAGEVRGSVGETVKFAVGGDISFTRQSGLRDGVVPPAGEVYPTRAFPETDFMLAGVFASAEFTFGPLTLYPALRFDAYDLKPENDPLLPTFAGADQSGSRVSPKIGAVVRLGDNVRVFGNFSQGFKAPAPSQVNNFFENLVGPFAYYRSVPNPNLRPETSRSFEGGLRFASDNVSFTFTGFHSEYDNFIEQIETTGLPTSTLANPWIYQWVNLAGAELTGVEASAEVRPAAGVSTRLSLSYVEGDGINGAGVKTPLQSIDPFRAVFSLGYDDPGNRFGARAVVTYSGEKKDADTLGSGCYATLAATPTCFTGGDYVTLDLTAYVRIVPSVTLRAGLFNLTDRKYWQWQDIRGLSDTSTVKDAYSQPGRNGSVSLSYRF